MNAELRAYRDDTAARPGDVERLRRTIGRPKRAIAPIVAGVALAAAAILAVAWPRAAAIQPGELAEGPSALIPGVDVDLVGAAAWAPTRAGAHLTLRSGEIAVGVAPGKGLDVAVQTPEAVVRVVGTAFTVRRSLDGTVVDVRHGRVSVACVAGDTSLLGAGETTTCPTASPGLWLGRARALLEKHAPTAEVLDAVRSGLAVATPGSALAAELRLVGVQAQVADDPRAALDELGQYLATGGQHRRAEAVHQGALLAFGLGGCAQAQAWLAAVAPEAPGEAAALGCR